MIALLLRFSQRVKLGFLGRRLAVLVKITQTLIASICQTADMLGKDTAAFFEQRKIMLAALGKCGGNDFLRLLVDNQLCFLGVTLLFAAVMPALLFFGRSIFPVIQVSHLGWQYAAGGYSQRGRPRSVRRQSASNPARKPRRAIKSEPNFPILPSPGMV